MGNLECLVEEKISGMLNGNNNTTRTPRMEAQKAKKEWNLIYPNEWRILEVKLPPGEPKVLQNRSLKLQKS